MLSFSFYTCLALFVLVCLILILLILIQKGRGGGLSGAFGGAGGNTAFGSKTGDVLTWATSIVFGVFLLLAIALNLISNRMDANAREQASAAEIVAPAAPAMPQFPDFQNLPSTPAPAPTTPAPVAPAPSTPAPAAPAAETPVEPAPAPTPVPAAEEK